jgi:serine/threonine protein kinase
MIKNCSENRPLLSSPPLSPTSPMPTYKIADSKEEKAINGNGNSNGYEKLEPMNENNETSMNASVPSPVFTKDEIVECIIKNVQKAEIYNSTYWDNMSRFMLKNTIMNIHSQNHKEYLKDFLVYKQYDNASDAQPHIIKYGMFKHKCFNLMFRIDNTEDQITGEDIVSSTLLQKYDNNYQDIIRLGIVIPAYCHIKLSNPQLFYSVQPFVTNGITLDRWIKTIQNKGNFDEIVYDVFMQLSAILKELHEVDCVHGDIKPANILIVQQQNANTKHYSNNVTVYLIDFGLSGIHEKTKCASGGTLPFCAPETENTNANTRHGNNVIKYPQHFNYNWLKHNKSHDIWSLGVIFVTIYIFKSIKLYYHEYPSDFFLPSGYISSKYIRMVKHEYIRNILGEHILVEPSKRCDIFQLNNIMSNLAFM